MTKPAVKTVKEAHEVAVDGRITVYYFKNHEPKTKLTGVTYVEIVGMKPMLTAVKELAGGLDDKLTLSPVYCGDGNYNPSEQSVAGEVVGLTVISKKDALALLGSKRLTTRTRQLAQSVLWSVNRKSFT